MGKTFGELNTGDKLICLERDKLDYFKYYNLEVIDNCIKERWIKVRNISEETDCLFIYKNEDDLIQKRRDIDLQRLNELAGRYIKDNYYYTEYIFETIDECKSFVFNICKDKITTYLKTIFEVSKW